MIERSGGLRMMAEPNTVIIDVASAARMKLWPEVRNRYETEIGHFQPPQGGAEFIDPKAHDTSYTAMGTLYM